MKCHQYYPDYHESVAFGDMTIRCTTQTEFPIHTARTLVLMKVHITTCNVLETLKTVHSLNLCGHFLVKIHCLEGPILEKLLSCICHGICSLG